MKTFNYIALISLILNLRIQVRGILENLLNTQPTNTRK